MVHDKGFLLDHHRLAAAADACILEPIQYLNLRLRILTSDAIQRIVNSVLVTTVFTIIFITLDILKVPKCNFSHRKKSAEFI